MSFVKDHNKLAISYKGKEYSYKDIIVGAKYYSDLLNIDEEDRVVIFTGNRPEIAYGLLGIWEKKGTSVNLDAGYNSEELAYVFEDAKPKYIFTSEENYEIALEAKKKTNSDVEILKFEDLVIPEGYTPNNYEVEAPRSGKTALMLYTSGTTGNPKGVMLTVDNILANVIPLKEIKIFVPEDRFIALLPMHHILPLMGTLIAPLYMGSTIVIIDELSSESIKNSLRDYKITVMVGVPRLWELLHKGIMSKIAASGAANKIFNVCKKIDNEKLSKIAFKKVYEGLGGHLRILASGGAKLDPEIMEDFKVLGLTILEGYGLTETSPILTFNRPGEAVIGSVGEAIPGVDLRIADDGEILAKGSTLMKGYFNKPEATKEAIDSDGWFHTGDLGKLEDGFLHIIGRKKEMIVLSNGKNINPGDIEIELIKGTDLIEEVAIVEHNKHLVAIVYPDFKLVEEQGIVNIKEKIKWEIVDKYNVTAPKYRKILDIKIVKEELPKTKLGKLRRFMLNDLIVDSGEKKKDVVKEKKDNPEEHSVEYIKLKEYLMETHKLEITPESHLELDLGLDSLDIVEILSFIETHFGAEITEEDFARVNNVESLCKLIREKGGDYVEGDVNWQKMLNEDVHVEMNKSSLVSTMINIVTTPIIKSKLDIDVKGLENLNKKPCIFVGNHQSFLDGFILNHVLPSDVRDDTYYLAIAIHFESKFRKALATRGNVILVDINKNLKETLQIAAKVLRDGKNLVIFPEGARTRDGELQEFKKTFAILSKELDIPVIPFAIDGAYDAMPYGSNKINKGKVSVEFFESLGGKDIEPETLTSDVREIVANKLAK